MRMRSMEDACTKTRSFLQTRRQPEGMGLVLSLGAPADSNIGNCGGTWDNMAALNATPTYGTSPLAPEIASISSELHMDQQKILEVCRK